MMPQLGAIAVCLLGLATWALLRLLWARHERRQRAAQPQPVYLVTAVPDEPITEEIVLDAPTLRTETLPLSRVADASGYVILGNRTVHRCCVDARRDGRPALVCHACDEKLRAVSR